MERCFRVLIVITRDWTDQGIVKNHTLCAYGMAMRASKVPMSEMRPYSPCFWNSATMPRPGHGARQNSSNVHSCTGAAYAWPRRKLRRGDPGLCRTLGRSSCPRRRPDGTHCGFGRRRLLPCIFGPAGGRSAGPFLSSGLSSCSWAASSIDRKPGPSPLARKPSTLSSHFEASGKISGLLIWPHRT